MRKVGRALLAVAADSVLGDEPAGRRAGASEGSIRASGRKRRRRAHAAAGGGAGQRPGRVQRVRRNVRGAARPDGDEHVVRAGPVSPLPGVDHDRVGRIPTRRRRADHPRPRSSPMPCDAMASPPTTSCSRRPRRPPGSRRSPSRGSCEARGDTRVHPGDVAATDVSRRRCLPRARESRPFRCRPAPSCGRPRKPRIGGRGWFPRARRGSSAGTCSTNSSRGPTIECGDGSDNGSALAPAVGLVRGVGGRSSCTAPPSRSTSCSIDSRCSRTCRGSRSTR